MSEFAQLHMIKLVRTSQVKVSRFVKGLSKLAHDQKPQNIRATDNFLFGWQPWRKESHMKNYSSKTEMLLQGIYISGKAWQIKADKSCKDSKTFQGYMRHVDQQSHGRKSLA